MTSIIYVDGIKSKSVYYSQEGYMGIAEKIRIMLVKRGNISEAELSRRLMSAGCKNMSPQNFNNKMKRETFNKEEIRKIEEVLNCTYSVEHREWFTMNDTGEEI
jgi:hypothetical protein